MSALVPQCLEEQALHGELWSYVNKLIFFPHLLIQLRRFPEVGLSEGPLQK